MTAMSLSPRPLALIAGLLLAALHGCAQSPETPDPAVYPAPPSEPAPWSDPAAAPLPPAAPGDLQSQTPAPAPMPEELAPPPGPAEITSPAPVPLPAPPPGPAPGPARGPDAWVLTLAWSPEYCQLNLGSKEPQCTEERYFELGGLQPRYRQSPDPGCADENLPREALDEALWVLPNKALLRKIWRSQGACSGLGSQEYLLQLDRARRRVAIPEDYAQAAEKRSTTVTALKEAFMRSNPGLDPDEIVPRCRGSWLREVRLCVDGNFEFQACDVDVADLCRDEIRVRPLKRSRAGRLPE